MDRTSFKIYIRLRGDIPGGVITTASNLKEITIHDLSGR